MLERNKRIKAMPERFQDTSEEFDVIFTVEERIYDAVLEGVCAPIILRDLLLLISRFIALFTQIWRHGVQTATHKLK